MTIIRDDYVLDVDVQKTSEYYEKHSLCDCSPCKNFYIQVKTFFPLLSSFLADFGVKIDKPDETGWSEDGEEICYDFSAYTVVGKITKAGKPIIDLEDGGLSLKIKIDRQYVPNEQKADYFVITVYGIRLPNITKD